MHHLLLWLLTPLFKRLSNRTFNTLLMHRRKWQLRAPTCSGDALELPTQVGEFIVTLSNGEQRRLWFVPLLTYSGEWYLGKPQDTNDVGTHTIINGTDGKEHFLINWKAVS